MSISEGCSASAWHSHPVPSIPSLSPSMAQPPSAQHCHQPRSSLACPSGWWVPRGTHPSSQPLVPHCDSRGGEWVGGSMSCVCPPQLM